MADRKRLKKWIWHRGEIIEVEHVEGTTVSKKDQRLVVWTPQSVSLHVEPQDVCDTRLEAANAFVAHCGSELVRAWDTLESCKAAFRHASQLRDAVIVEDSHGK